MDAPKILITGATGYIGGSILTSLLTTSDPTLKRASYAVLLRKATQEALFQSLNVTTVTPKDPEDVNELRTIASNFDIIINPGMAIAAEKSRAFVLGLGDRKKETGRETRMIQTSGTSNLSDRPFTLPSRASKIAHEFSDLSSEQTYQTEKQLDEEEPYDQRTSELAVIDTGLEVGVKTYVIMSPTIYGPGTGPANTISIQIPMLIRSALRNNFLPVLGEGKEEWDNIHIHDLVSQYAFLLNLIISGKEVSSGKSGIFFSTTGRHSWRGLSQTVIDVGKKLGKLPQEVEIRSVDLKEATAAWGMPEQAAAFAELAFASNSRTKGEWFPKAGWKGEEGYDDLERWIEEDWKAVMEKNSL